MSWWHDGQFTDKRSTDWVDRRKAFGNGHRPCAIYDRCELCRCKWSITDHIGCWRRSDKKPPANKVFKFKYDEVLNER